MLELKLLGRFEVRLDGQPLEIASRPAQSLLAYLALNANLPIDARGWPDCCGPTPATPTPAIACATRCGACAAPSAPTARLCWPTT